MKKVLYVNLEYPLANIHSGASVRSLALLRALCACSYTDVISFSKEPGIPFYDNCRIVFNNYIERISDFPRFSFNYLSRVIHFWDPNSFFLCDKIKEKIIDEIYEIGDYDFIVVRYLKDACECGLMKYGKKLIIDIDDDPSEKCLAACNIEGISVARKMIYVISAFTLRFVMKNILKKSFHCFFSNPFQARSASSSFLPNVSILDHTPSDSDFSSASTKRVIAVGNWLYYPNYAGILHFIQDIFPLIRKYRQDIDVDIVGVIDENIVSQYGNVDGLNFLGYVEDLSVVYASCRAVVAPIYIGAGTCVKVIEAMSMKRPVVSSPFGVRGLSEYFSEGRDYLLGRTDEEFAKQVITIATDAELNHIIADNAYRVVVRSLSMDSFQEKVRKVIYS